MPDDMALHAVPDPDPRARARALRAEGRSLSEIARALGVGKTTVHRWIAGSAPASEKVNTPKEARPPRPKRRRTKDGGSWAGLIIGGILGLGMLWATIRRSGIPPAP